LIFFAVNCLLITEICWWTLNLISLFLDLEVWFKSSGTKIIQ